MKANQLNIVANIPPSLNMEAWERWYAYRKAIKKPIKEPSVEAAMRKLAAFGPDQSAVVENSIAEGYQGLFPAKTQPQAKLPQSVGQVRTVMINAEMEELKKCRIPWGVPDFRDPLPTETVSQYRMAMDNARVARFERPRIFSVK